MKDSGPLVVVDVKGAALVVARVLGEGRERVDTGSTSKAGNFELVFGDGS